MIMNVMLGHLGCLEKIRITLEVPNSYEEQYWLPRTSQPSQRRVSPRHGRQKVPLNVF